MKKTLITLYLPSLCGGGAERVMLNLAQGFAKRGHVVDLVLARAEGPYLKEVPGDVQVVDLRASRVLASLPGLVNYLQEKRPAVLLSALDHANITALWAGKISRVPTRRVISVHNFLSSLSQTAISTRDRLMPQWAKMFYRWADQVIAVSQGVAEDLSTLTGLPSEKIKIIYNPVVTPGLTDKARVPVRHPWLSQTEIPVILGVGRLNKAKDFPTLINALKLVHKQRQARLLILGEGEERPFLEELIHRLGLYHDVELCGFVNNPYQYMARAAVFVSSSMHEGFGNVLVEAMACGCPVVSTDCPGGPAEILGKGVYGFLVPVGDADMMAGKIIQTINSPPDPDSLKKRASLFSLQQIISNYLEVIL